MNVTFTNTTFTNITIVDSGTQNVIFENITFEYGAFADVNRRGDVKRFNTGQTMDWNRVEKSTQSRRNRNAVETDSVFDCATSSNPEIQLESPSAKTTLMPPPE